MRHKGRITDWQDDRGFGFITPQSGGERVFVHVRSLMHRQRRPVGGEWVTYELSHDPKGRLRAANVALSGDKAVRAPGPAAGSGGLLFAGGFLALVAAAVLAGSLPVEVLWLYLAVSVAAFAVYAWDKASARARRWRTPESTLHLLSAAGGWPGALVAQKLLRHKTNKRSFQSVFWVTVLLNCGGLAWLLTNPVP
jgi:uncharacterized membrane protein YsdA (DUF1294 family)/cold shock CspA family protein